MNRGVRVLQTLALPLGYGTESYAGKIALLIIYIMISQKCQHFWGKFWQEFKFFFFVLVKTKKKIIKLILYKIQK